MIREGGLPLHNDGKGSLVIRVSVGKTSAISSGETDIGGHFGSALRVLSGGAISDTVESGDVDNISISADATVTNATIFSTDEGLVFSGGTAVPTTVDNGASEFASSVQA